MGLPDDQMNTQLLTTDVTTTIAMHSAPSTSLPDPTTWITSQLITHQSIDQPLPVLVMNRSAADRQIQ
jgi:hypothetical protein